VFGAGLGAAAAEEFQAFVEDGNARLRAERLDESLALLDALWSGTPVRFDGVHHQVDSPPFLPRPLQSPRIPIWIAGRWPNRRPFRRAARWDGVFPTTATGVGDEPMPPPKLLAEIVRFTLDQRTTAGRFDVALECRSEGVDAAADAELTASYGAAGLTWWVEKIGWFRGDSEAMRGRVRRGPPAR
jgi:alkanesulfonate monooxygenase SsuD/methylene tetrahydromethanopterin reductase-like flavin-dependent oxidoreductase (luciferase family)